MKHLTAGQISAPNSIFFRRGDFNYKRCAVALSPFERIREDILDLQSRLHDIRLPREIADTSFRLPSSKTTKAESQSLPGIEISGPSGNLNSVASDLVAWIMCNLIYTSHTHMTNAENIIAVYTSSPSPSQRTPQPPHP